VTSYVALLRGIAPTNPKMKTAELVAVFESLAFERVRPVLATGNLVFETDERRKGEIETRVESALHDHLGAPCSTIVRSRRQIDHILGLDVFDAYEDGPTDRCNVTFLKRGPPASGSVPDVAAGAVVVAVRDRAVFSVIDMTRSKTPNLMARLERTYGKEITTRTWRTVHRISRAFDR
jgi:uncharacterized protein (DUF1697 family)